MGICWAIVLLFLQILACDKLLNGAYGSSLKYE